MELMQEKIVSLLQYREALESSDKEIFDRLVAYAKGHVSACAKANSLTVLESMLLAMVIEQQKVIEKISNAA